jgi:2-polyprenyl-6-methoxyphenol hydroxylase-like FAD-dependent oxidoreductase
MYQPHVEDALNAAACKHATVEVNHGWEAVDMEAHDDCVAVTFAQGRLDGDGVYTHTGEHRTVRGRYLIGADGANSFTRSCAGLRFDDLGFREQWLVVDFRQKRPLSFAFDNGQICDPARPLCLFQLGKTHRRFEFMVLPGEDPVEIARPDNIWPLVARWITPADAELIRSTVYTFRSANAERWRSGRIFIAGDAAHLMPPFLGQGMCSGVRDVANLSWKLDLVLRGLADDALLDSYMLERKPHVGGIIEQAVALGKVSCTIDPEEARLRDAAFLSGDVPPPPPFPWIRDGIVDENAPLLAGRLGPQAKVETGGRTGLADDVLGSGWQLICRQGLPASLRPQDRQTLETLGARIIELDAPGGVRDVDGDYSRFLDEAAVEAVLTRPDCYIFGASNPDYPLTMLIANLAEKLGLRRSSEQAAALA